MNVLLRKFPIVQNIPHLRTTAAQGATSFLDRRILGCVQGQVNAAKAETETAQIGLENARSRALPRS